MYKDERRRGSFMMFARLRQLCRLSSGAITPLRDAARAAQVAEGVRDVARQCVRSSTDAATRDCCDGHWSLEAVYLIGGAGVQLQRATRPTPPAYRSRALWPGEGVGLGFP